MKTTLKKSLSFLLALILLLTLSVPAFAEGSNGTLTVNGDSGAKGQTVSLYKLFDVEVTGEGDSATYAYTLNDKYSGFFTGKIDDFASMTDSQKSDAAYRYELGLGESDSTNVQAFANAFITWIAKQTPAITADKTGSMSNDESSQVVIDEVPYGYYLVFAGNAPASLVNVNSATGATVNLKTEYPTVEKKIVDGENKVDYISSEIGETVKFELESKVPDMSGYTAYTFNFADTLSAGLTLDADSLVVKVGETTLTKDTDYTVSVVGQSLTIAMQNMIGKSYTTGDAIVVTYSATVNENAVVAGAGNTNSATVQYSNDPANPTVVGTSTTDIVKVYTFDIDLNKVAYKSDVPLAGAKFKLVATNDVDAAPISLVKVTDNVYRLAKAGETGETVVNEVTTDATGIITIKGLKAGTYYLVETSAPDGYNKLSAPVEVTIAATFGEDGTLTSWTVNGNANNDVVIENRSGSILPGTGAIGTAAFAVVGVALVIGGSQLLGKKKEDESDN